jgi:hypothetical protein
LSSQSVPRRAETSAASSLSELADRIEQVLDVLEPVAQAV